MATGRAHGNYDTRQNTVSAVAKVQVKCYGGSAGREPGGRQRGAGFLKDAASAWASKGADEDVPGDENSKTQGTEAGDPGVPSRSGAPGR